MKKQLIIDLENYEISTNYFNDYDQIDIEFEGLNFQASKLSGYEIIGINRLNVFSNDKNSKVGGFFSHYLKCNNYDIISFKGKSPKPVFVYINKEEVGIYDAESFFFNDYKESRRYIENILNRTNLEICGISYAGAYKVDFSKIMFGENKSCGKNGLGKLMGEKNLKSIVLEKQKTLELKDKEFLNKLNKNINSKLNNNKDITSYFCDSNNCYGCNINCKSTSIKKLINKGIVLSKAEEIDNICNEYGMDSIAFSQFINDKQSLTELANEIIKNPQDYRVENNINKRKKKKEDKLDEFGFCKFLINKNIITNEELENLIKIIES